MATFYLDLENGNDANDGTTFANRWKTFTSGATAARIAPGDTVRIMGSPDPTLVGSVTWTNDSRLLTLPGAVTMNIATCDTAWTAATNVTASASTTTLREGTASANLAVASGFTTGLIAYFATGLLDLSAYQQVSFMLRTSIVQAAGNLQLKLCSDAAGAVPVHTFNIDIMSASCWVPQVFDNGAALSSSIQSVALYAAVDPGAVTINIDNIIACKAPSSADALTHNSLIGKVHNLYWTSGATYAVGNQRKPTPPNRNGFTYKATAITTGVAGTTEPAWPTELGLTVIDGGVTWTCYGPEESWFGIGSINGTTVGLACDPSVAGVSTLGTYQGETETVATYKREPTYVAANVVSSGNGASTCVIQDSGTAQLPITFSGGWNRTDMSTQTSETWSDGRTGAGASVLALSHGFLTFSNFNGVRYSNGIALSNTNVRNQKLENCHFTSCATSAVAVTTGVRWEFSNLSAQLNGGGVTTAYVSSFRGRCLQISGLSSAAVALQLPPGYTEINYFWFRGNAGTTSIAAGNTTTNGAYSLIKNLITANNAAVISPNAGGIDLVNPNFGEGVTAALGTQTAGLDGYVTLTRAQNTDGDHRRYTDGGSIVSATDQRHTASGIAWKFLPTDTGRADTYPLRMAVAQVQVLAGTPKTVSIWTRRDNTNIKGRLVVRGGWLPGMQEQYVDCQPAINTWVQSGTITLSATSDGIAEVEFLVWDGIGTSNSFWIDDLSVT